MFHKFVTQIRDQRRVVPGARAIHTGCRYSRSSLWVINATTALLELKRFQVAGAQAVSELWRQAAMSLRAQPVVR